jgi:hypothetical protein
LFFWVKDKVFQFWLRRQIINKCSS